MPGRRGLVSKDGLSAYRQITGKRVYPDIDGRFEDPVVWKDSLQYHLIVNDWLGRIAYYQRSKDGLHWVTEQGEAYMPEFLTIRMGKWKNGSSMSAQKYSRTVWEELYR